MYGKIRIIAISVLVILILSFVYLFYGGDVAAPSSPIESEIPVEKVEETQSVHSIAINREFKKGVHMVSGTVSLPTPCYSLNVSAQVSSTSPESATLEFVSGDTGGVCIQIIDERRFEVSFSASEEVVLKGVWNGSEILLTTTAE